MLLGASGLKITLEVPAASEIARNHANDSQTFSYKDLICHVDSLQLEESISSQYANMLLSGRSIMIPYQTWDNTLQHLTVQTGSQTCNVAKNFTRLATVFTSLAQEEPTITADLAKSKGSCRISFIFVIKAPLMEMWNLTLRSITRGCLILTQLDAKCISKDFWLPAVYTVQSHMAPTSMMWHMDV